MNIEPIAQACLTFWSSSYIVKNGQAWKKSKAGKRMGKPLASSQIIADLRDHVPAYRSADPTYQLGTLDFLLAQGTEDESGEGDGSAIEEVDPWLVPLLLVFRWKSDGTIVRGFFHKPLALHIAAGGDPNDTSVVRELSPITVTADDCLANALMQDIEIWEQYESAYKSMIEDPTVRVTPKAVKEGVRFYHSFRNYLKVMMAPWLSDVRFHIPADPLTVSNKPSEWAFWHFGPYTHSIMDNPEPTPAWDGWLNKLGNEDRKSAFRAWIFSVCFAKNKSRQLLWMEGRGGDGKGAVANALIRFLGDRGAQPVSDATFVSDFGASEIYGHRLLIHPDCKNPRLLSYALVHQITGGDMIRVNPKHGQMFRTQMDAKMMVLANCPPDIDVYNLHESSRILFLLINPQASGSDNTHLEVDTKGRVQLKGDPTFSNRLYEEMPSFLAKSMTDYRKLCPTNGNIVLPESLVNDISDRCASVEQERFEKFYEDNFESDKDCWVETSTIKDVFERLMPSGMKSHLQYGAFVKYLEAMGHRKIRPARADGTRVRGFIGLKPRGSEGMLLSGYMLHKNHVGVDSHEGQVDDTGKQEECGEFTADPTQCLGDYPEPTSDRQDE